MPSVIIHFPDGQKFTVPLAPIMAHREDHYSIVEPNDPWWRSKEFQRPGVIALWPQGNMSWPELAPHCTPSASAADTTLNRFWQEKNARIKLSI